MKCERTKFTIKALVEAWNDTSLKINLEYQRGASWTTPQKQGLVDSLFRDYPIPPLFLHRIKGGGLGGMGAVRFEIVDGQQRIRALTEYFSGNFPLLSPTDRRLRLPNSLRIQPCAWSNQRFAELSMPLREQLAQSEIEVFLITDVSNPDEIRDLFIRLQAGTALSRQQVRDAWPGNVGPFIEELAGKMSRQPSSELFRIVDKRGPRSDDEGDDNTSDRQFAAQLLCLFLARESDRGSHQSIGANDLDKLYHENTMLDSGGQCAKRFKEVLEHTTKVFQRASANNVANRTKFRKLEVMSVFLLVQDLSRNPNLKLDSSFYSTVAAKLPGGSGYTKSTSGPSIAAFYEEWRNALPDTLGIRLDPKRLFDADQQQVIYSTDRGLCAICGSKVEMIDAEFDHYPIPWRDGGRTNVENGRLVHRACHPRGRPVAEAE